MDPVFVEQDRTVSPDDDSVKITLLRLGPFLDFYPEPAGGFHVVTAAALTVQVESDVKGNAVQPAALGAALAELHDETAGRRPRRPAMQTASVAP